MDQIAELRADNDGKLPAYAWPGGYPMYYLGQDEERMISVYCVECANQDGADPPIIAAEVNWEDHDLHCEGCGKRIESAYAED